MALKKKRKAAGKAKRAVTKRAKKAPAKRKPAPRRVSAKKKQAKAAKRPAKQGAEARLEKVGEVTHYFPKVKAAAILVLKDGLKRGDSIYIKGHTTNFSQRIGSLQLDHVPVEAAKKADEIGLLVKSRVRIGDTVYRV